jgi:predicted nucleic acid-binding protein
VSPALYLIDTSGLFRILQDKLRQEWTDQLAAGVIATCPVVELEFLYSARSLADRLEKHRLLREVFGWVPMSDRAYERADEVQQLLTETGRHRLAGPVDLLIAATAEREGLIVLCDNRDYRLLPRHIAARADRPPARSRDSPTLRPVLRSTRYGAIPWIAGGYVPAGHDRAYRAGAPGR